MITSLDILCCNPLDLRNKIRKIEHKKIFCGPSKILKNISWLINICLKYFMTPTKTLRPQSYILMYSPELYEMLSIRKPTNDCCYCLTSFNLYTVKEMCSRWYRSQFNKFEKALVWVEILCLDFQKTPSNQNIKSSKVSTFKNCEIFSNCYFSYVRDYKITLITVKNS